MLYPCIPEGFNWQQPACPEQSRGVPAHSKQRRLRSRVVPNGLSELGSHLATPITTHPARIRVTPSHLGPEIRSRSMIAPSHTPAAMLSWRSAIT